MPSTICRLGLLLLLWPAAAGAQSAPHDLMPAPAALTWQAGRLAVDSAFSVQVSGHTEPRLERAIARLRDRLSRQTGIPIGFGLPPSAEPRLVVAVAATGGAWPALGADESYRLTVTGQAARLEAATTWGALHGLQTLSQLVQADAAGFGIPAVTIEDRPRFPWRGLLIDVARHWMPPEVIRRTLDGMAAVKLNVLHWHLSEDQGFRVESRVYPRLQQLGSDGNFYTQDDIREIVDYAADRGIRVVPEFDVPGHATSWLVAYPHLGSAPGPYSIIRRWGVFDPTLDPTRPETYAFLDAFFGEMAALFPDHYLHIGGDEVSGKHWRANAAIQAFIRREQLGDNHGLQAYFNRRLLEILARHGKRMVGWDEIFHPDLPRDIVIQSWRGQQALADAARQGYQGLLSNGYYLDHILSAATHYQVDPLAGPAGQLSGEEQARILGGEACMWAEFVTPETIDSRIWPRAAAIAERLWSPAEVSDVPDMYRRLAATSLRLEGAGLTHRTGPARMLARLAGGTPPPALMALAEVVEPVKFYQRPASRRYTSLTPLNRLVDAVPPESDSARVFGERVDAFLTDPARPGLEALRQSFRRWEGQQAALMSLWPSRAVLGEAQAVSAQLAAAARAGREALAAFEGAPLSADRRTALLALLDGAAQPAAEVLVMVVPPIRRLVEAAPSAP